MLACAAMATILRKQLAPAAGATRGELPAEAMAEAPDEKGGGPEVIGMGGNDGDGSADAGGGDGFS